MEPPPARDVRRFLLLAFALSWASAWPLAASAQGWIPVRLHPALHLLIGFGPALAALLVTPRGFLRRALRWPGWRWAMAGLLLPFAFALLGVAGAALLREAGLVLAPPPPPEDGIVGVLLFAPVFILAFGLGEEVGWRGWLQPRLETRFSARTATLAVAGIWLLWHLPLMVDPAAIGKGGGPGILGACISIVSGAFLMAWLARRSGSALAGAFFHGMLNVASTLVSDPYAGHVTTFALGLCAIGLASRSEVFVDAQPTAEPQAVSG